jgi:hypothetical protein
MIKSFDQASIERINAPAFKAKTKVHIMGTRAGMSTDAGYTKSEIMRIIGAFQTEPLCSDLTIQLALRVLTLADVFEVIEAMVELRERIIPIVDAMDQDTMEVFNLPEVKTAFQTSDSEGVFSSIKKQMTDAGVTMPGLQSVNLMQRARWGLQEVVLGGVRRASIQDGMEDEVEKVLEGVQARTQVQASTLFKGTFGDAIATPWKIDRILSRTSN